MTRATNSRSFTCGAPPALPWTSRKSKNVWVMIFHWIHGTSCLIQPLLANWPIAVFLCWTHPQKSCRPEWIIWVLIRVPQTRLTSRNQRLCWKPSVRTCVISIPRNISTISPMVIPAWLWVGQATLCRHKPAQLKPRMVWKSPILSRRKEHCSGSTWWRSRLTHQIRKLHTSSSTSSWTRRSRLISPTM